MPDSSIQAADYLATAFKFLVGLFGSVSLTVKALGIGGAFAALVVMCLKWPRTAREGIVAFVTTLIFSFCGGALALIKLNLLHEAATMVDALAIIGLAFSCGLPGWLVVRLVFNQLQKYDVEGKGLFDAIRELRKAFKEAI